MISGDDIQILRSIARVNGDYERIKQKLAPTAWTIEEDEVDLGFMRISIPDATDADGYGLIIGYRDHHHHPTYAFLTFYTFPESEKSIPEFDTAFHRIADVLQEHLGEPNVSGERRVPARSCSYGHHRWSLPEGEFTLVQDEFDIQNGLDITLWIEAPGTPIDSRLR